MKNENLSTETKMVLDMIYGESVVNLNAVRQFITEVGHEYDPIRIALILTGRISEPDVNTTSDKINKISAELKDYNFYSNRVRYTHLKKRPRYFENESDAFAFAQATYGTDEYNALIKKSSPWKDSDKPFLTEGFVEETSYCSLEEWQ